ncbi:MAG: acyltransferase family protein [Eggerthellaceae bacterium]|jgi:fucose 4-O-acetylase-like acetyltransferase|nr:acyltransferase family protein [Eggerthellaceae bacterium]MDR2721543.1 acyltransferase family protein [Coriobacteriaceae bacterium]
MAKVREYRFDNFKLLLIFLVVFGHFLELFLKKSVTAELYTIIYTFHMPAFIFISGYFSKRFDVANLIKSIIVPYVIFGLLYAVFISVVFDKSFSYSFFTPYWILWYLFSLLIWKLITPIFTKLKYHLVVAFAVGLLISIDSSVGYFASMSRTFVFFPFFLLGYNFNKEFLDNKKSILGLAGLVLALLLTYFVLIKGFNISYHFLYGSHAYDAIGWGILMRACVYAIAILFILSLLVVIYKKKIPFVTVLGANTIVTYLMHGFVIKYLASLNIFTDMSFSTSIILALVLSTTIVVAFGNRYVTKYFDVGLAKLSGLIIKKDPT